MTAADVYRALWRHKALILVLTAVFVGATWFVTSRQTKTYEATTLVRIQQRIATPADAFGSLQTSGRLAQTYANVIDSGVLDDTVGRAVSSRLPAERGSTAALSATPVEDLALLWISARSHHPRAAAVAADTAAGALGRFTSKTSTLGDRVTTIKHAAVPTAPISPRLSFNLGLAVMLGLIFNGALALLIEVLRDRMPDPEELGRVVGYPVLATIPSLRLRRMEPEPAGRSGNGRAAEEIPDETNVVR